MASLRLTTALSILAFVLAPFASAQQPIAPSPFGAIDANGMLLAQNSAAIEQARLYRDAIPPKSLGVDANGNALPAADASSSDDDSMGAQLILKSQERVQHWTLSGGASLNYTSNVALTKTHTKDDVFGIIDAGAGWAGRIGRNLDGDIGIHLGAFRYHETSSLDFQSIGFGMGLVWNPPSLPGVGVFARYDFTELLTPDFDQILMDHIITLGVQKSFVFGRSHGLTIGALGMADFSDPASAQRSQLGAFLTYHLQITRKLQSDLLIRPAVHFYTDTGRTDFNQIISWNLRYRFNEWAELNAYLSYGLDRSDHSHFDYDAFSTGAGLSFNVRF